MTTIGSIILGSDSREMINRLSYLLKPSKKECFYLGPGRWDNIFPDVIDKNKLSISCPFKYNYIFPKRRTTKLSYRKYLSDTVNLIPNHDIDCFYKEIEVEDILKKVEHWAGDDDILFSHPHFMENRYVLTGSHNPDDKLGIFNHYLKKIRFKIKNQMSRYRMWKLRRNQRDLSYVIAEARESLQLKSFSTNNRNTITVIATASEPEK